MSETINSLKGAGVGRIGRTDERLCIWCGSNYRIDMLGADQCFCAGCNDSVPPSARGAARVQWMAAKPENTPSYADLGQCKDASWPPNFPVKRRSAFPI